MSTNLSDNYYLQFEKTFSTMLNILPKLPKEHNASTIKQTLVTNAMEKTPDKPEEHKDLYQFC